MHIDIKKIAIIWAIILSAFIKESFFNISLAQVDSSGFAISIPVVETQIEEGDVVCSYNEGFARCISPYDTSVYGVIVDDV